MGLDERGLEALALAVRWGEDADLAFEAIALEEKRGQRKKRVSPEWSSTAKPGEKIIREFTCKACGKLVQVTKPRDKRSKFCSEKCRDWYWKDKYLSDPIDGAGTKNKRKRKRKAPSL